MLLWHSNNDFIKKIKLAIYQIAFGKKTEKNKFSVAYYTVDLFFTEYFNYLPQ